jgi:uncharacterized protein YkwD
MSSSRVFAVIVAVTVLTVFAPGSSLGQGSSWIAAGATTVAGIQQSIRECANRNRRAAGLEPLSASRVLTQAAALHARNMAQHRFFEHTDSQGRGPAERVEMFDNERRFTFVGENIAAGYTSVHRACGGWMRSAGHRANILGGNYTHVGGGYATGGPYRSYYVQVFAERIEPETPVAPETRPR